MGAELVGGIIAGVGALAGGIATGAGAASAARTSANYASQTSAEDRQFAREMNQWNIERANEVFGMENTEYDRRLANQTGLQKELLVWLQKNFNSPEAQAKALRAAGLSPSVIYGNGQNPFGSISVPEVSSPSSPAINNPGLSSSVPGHIQPQFNNVGAGIGQGLSSAAQVAAQTYNTLQQSAKTDTENEQLKNMFADVLKGIQLKNANQETKNAYDNLTLSLYRAYGDKEKALTVSKLAADAYNAFMQGDESKANAALSGIQKNMLDRKDKIEAAAFVDVQFWANNLIEDANLSLSLKRAQINTERYRPTLMRSESSANYARAAWENALVKTENDLRSGKIEALSLSNDMTTLQKFLLGNDLKFSDATLASKTAGFIADMNTKQIGSDIAQQELVKIQKENDWYERHAFADYCLKWSYVFNNVVSSFVTMRGQNMRFDVGNERNQFQHEFNQMWRETKMSDVKNTAPGKQNGVGSILDHVPDADRGYYEGMWKPY